MGAPIRLSPSQQATFDAIHSALPLANVFEVRAKAGRGRSTVLRALHRALGGALLTMGDYVEAAARRHPLALEDTLYELLVTSLRSHGHVFLDDLHLITAVACDCHFYPRMGLLNAPLMAAVTYAAESGKKLFFACDGHTPAPVAQRSCSYAIEAFTAADYGHLCETFIGKAARQLDIDKVYRFAPKLNAHQIRAASSWCEGNGATDTESFIDFLRSQRLASNVELSEVADVDLSALKGVDDVIRSLEANIVLPLENDELAKELHLSPKRGVLLVGPPGTGKTTVGRALARRLKGKFFLIDGTIISGTSEFYGRVHQVFEAAKENAPSIIFIDDSDVIFESGEEHGLYRYLLTMLDGLEGKSAARVCVMLTAMDVGNLPPALIRSGRIELWLEMRPPDGTARELILRQQIDALPQPLRGADVARLAAETEGFTGADLRRLAEDGRMLYAYDRSCGRAIRPITEYYLQAARLVSDNKQRYAQAEVRLSARRPVRPPWFFEMSPVAADADDDDE